ncbi:hypothetical protein GCM10017056_18980 [Seohaeicola zhoushanensis]|uniref:Uncharacterized protein n=2 Tax=Seohaeicola zhoushanensis TaxID=1569283 RepID=A0A8J3M7P6_9RHOB|nr:hypothetical protein GCM10017056_18980 [Seohaeicola zhoushanensis]
MMYGGYGMGGGGLIWLLVLAALLVVPFWRILPRNGIPSWVALVAIIPLGALILLWVVAFKDQLDGGKA